MRRPPSDFKLLKLIYSRHRRDFESFVEEHPSGRSSKILVPVNLQRIADACGVDVNSIFGRLYYHLDPKYGEAPGPSGGARKVFFTPVAGDDRDCVNFPLLEAVLAGLWEERRKDVLITTTAFVSLGIAVASLVVSIVTA